MLAFIADEKNRLKNEAVFFVENISRNEEQRLMIGFPNGDCVLRI